MSKKIKDKLNKIYWPVYKILEREVLELARSIHFVDEQIRTYSLKTADLIIRCSTELESVGKDIFRRENGKEPKETGVCFNWLSDSFRLAHKELIIATPYFYFENEFEPSFQPFNYKKDDENNYYVTYNSVKHDRQKNLFKADINTLIRVLGALFILNVYYKDEVIGLGDDIHGTKMDKSSSSEIFNFKVYPTVEGLRYTDNENLVYENCIYKIEKVETYAIKMTYIDEENVTRTENGFMINDGFQKFAKESIGKKIEVSEFLAACIARDTPQEVIDFFMNKKYVSLNGVKMKDSYRAILNR